MGMESNRNQIANAHSHTHCQAAQANAKTQAWQRVCLFQRTTKTTDKQTDGKEQRRHNSVYVAIAGEVGNRRSVLLRNFVPNGQVLLIRYCTYTRTRCAFIKNPNNN